MPDIKILRTALAAFLAIFLVTIGLSMAVKTFMKKPASRLAQPSAVQKSGIAASSITWGGHFGSNRSKPNIVYSLLAYGFFRAPTSDNIDSLIKEWTAAHPKARLIPVIEFGPAVTDQPDSKLIWVWLVDDVSNLNHELVRKGAVPGGTMVAPDNTHVLVPTREYARFESMLPKLEKLAKRKKIGIWKNGDRLE